MTVHSLLSEMLRADTDIQGLVDERVITVKARDTEECPYIVLRQNTPGYDYHLTGRSNPYHPSVEINCYGNNYSSARAVANAVIAAVEGWRGSDGVEHVVLLGDSDTEFDIDTNLFWIMLVYEVWFSD